MFPQKSQEEKPPQTVQINIFVFDKINCHRITELNAPLFCDSVANNHLPQADKISALLRKKNLRRKGNLYKHSIFISPICVICGNKQPPEANQNIISDNTYLA